MLKGDGRLGHDLDLLDQAPKDACGVFGVWAPGEDVSKLTYYGLYALQHRGQESAGIAVSEGSRILVYKDMGLVAQVFDESILGTLRGYVAIGHCRYSTTGSSVWENAQPTLSSTEVGGLALAHNGNLINTAELAERLAPGTTRATTDTEVLTALLARDHSQSVEDAAAELLPQVKGAYSLVWMNEKTLFAARDPQGIRPLVLGRLPGVASPGLAGHAAAGHGERSEQGDKKQGWVVASETAALDIVGASFIREIEPGELLTIDERGVRSRRFAVAEPKGCLFEYVYLARPDTTIAGRGVQVTRVEVGRELAREHPVDADLVIPTPESGTPAAIGFAEQSGIPYGQGLVKNSYVGRTFIQPSQTIRQLGIRLKLNPLREVIQGKRLVVVDDSIVRGNTQRAIVKMLREAGAVEVHVRISSPPVTWPCFYGIDFATQTELIAGALTVDEIRASLGADSLGYISLEGLTRATTIPAERLCRACFDGRYPIAIDQDRVGKHVLEEIK